MEQEHDFLAEFVEKDEMPFGEVENSNPPESQTEKPETNEDENSKPPQGGDNTPDDKKLDFHEHPRFKHVIEEKNQWKKQAEELEQQLNQLKQVEQFQKPAPTQAVPSWFSKLYGDDPEVWSAFQEYDVQLRASVKQEAIQELEQRRISEQKEVEQLNQWVDDEIKALEESGAKFEKNKLMKIAIDFSPTDENGNISLKKAYEIYKKFEENSSDEKSQARKQIGGLVTKSSNDAAPPKKDYFTPKDLKGWHITL